MNTCSKRQNFGGSKEMNYNDNENQSSFENDISLEDDDIKEVLDNADDLLIIIKIILRIIMRATFVSK